MWKMRLVGVFRLVITYHERSSAVGFIIDTEDYVSFSPATSQHHCEKTYKFYGNACALMSVI